MKPIMILQPFGLGDIIFIQTLVHRLAQERKIFWPAKPAFLGGLQKAYPHIEFVSEEKIDKSLMETKVKVADIDGMEVYGIRYAEWLMKRPYKEHMRSKYELYGLNWQIWKERAMPQRNIEAEAALLQHLRITDEPFNFVATKFGSEAKREIRINADNGYRNVELQVLPGFSLFDWMAVIELATTIHAVSSATLYLFEIMQLKANEVHLYPREPTEKNFDYVKFLFSKNYITHGPSHSHHFPSTAHRSARINSKTSR